jgi:hypothetical protein
MKECKYKTCPYSCPYWLEFELSNRKFPISAFLLCRRVYGLISLPASSLPLIWVSFTLSSCFKNTSKKLKTKPEIFIYFKMTSLTLDAVIVNYLRGQTSGSLEYSAYSIASWTATCSPSSIFLFLVSSAGATKPMHMDGQRIMNTGILWMLW